MRWLQFMLALTLFLSAAKGASASIDHWPRTLREPLLRDFDVSLAGRMHGYWSARKQQITTRIFDQQSFKLRTPDELVGIAGQLWKKIGERQIDDPRQIDALTDFLSLCSLLTWPDNWRSKLTADSRRRLVSIVIRKWPPAFPNFHLHRQWAPWNAGPICHIAEGRMLFLHWWRSALERAMKGDVSTRYTNKILLLYPQQSSRSAIAVAAGPKTAKLPKWLREGQEKKKRPGGKSRAEWWKPFDKIEKEKGTLQLQKDDLEDQLAAANQELSGAAYDNSRSALEKKIRNLQRQVNKVERRLDWLARRQAAWLEKARKAGVPPGWFR